MMSALPHGGGLPGSARRRVLLVAGWIGCVAFLGQGGWALLAPAHFHSVVAQVDPLNTHYLRDAGVFSTALGFALLVALIRAPAALPAVTLACGVGAALHVVSHMVDGDVVPLAILAGLLLTAGMIGVTSDPGRSS